MNKETIQKVREIKNYVQSFEYPMLNREPRFSCVSDSMIDFIITWGEQRHVFTGTDFQSFADGMTLEDLLDQVTDGYIGYSYWIGNEEIKSI